MTPTFGQAKVAERLLITKLERLFQATEYFGQGCGTFDLRIRNPTLYPAELRDRRLIYKVLFARLPWIYTAGNGESGGKPNGDRKGAKQAQVDLAERVDALDSPASRSASRTSSSKTARRMVKSNSARRHRWRRAQGNTGSARGATAGPCRRTRGRPDAIVMPPPVFDDNLGLLRRIEDFTVRQLASSVPILTLGSRLSRLRSKCQNHKEHWQPIVSSVALVTDVWLRNSPKSGTKRR